MHLMVQILEEKKIVLGKPPYTQPYRRTNPHLGEARVLRRTIALRYRPAMHLSRSIPNQMLQKLEVLTSILRVLVFAFRVPSLGA
jgi:hypothetical protein